MCVTFGYAVLVYLKETMAKEGLIGGSSQEYKLEINPADSFGLNPVVSTQSDGAWGEGSTG